jgi:hypothetical protein
MKKPLSIYGSVVAFVVALALSATPAVATIVFGQVDDFEDGTTMNWAGGPGQSNIPSGGPAGAGDNYLQIVSTGGGGPGSKMGSFNDNQWTGDYTTAGVTSIDADIRNFGTTGALHLRLLLFGDGGNFTSTIPFVVTNDGAWHDAVFPITPADLTAVDGGFDVAATLANITRFLIRHQPGAPDGVGGSPSIVGVMGMDNVTALPEPGTLGLLLLGGAALLRRLR